MARHAVRPSKRKSLAIGSNPMETLRSSACLIVIADVCMTSRSSSKNSKADLPSGTTSVMTVTGYSGPRFKIVLLEGGEALAAVAAYIVKGSSRSANKPPALGLATAQRVVEQQNGEVPLPQRLLW